MEEINGDEILKRPSILTKKNPSVIDGEDPLVI